jgi:two-component system, OmpR family, sensor histidine kinase CiaH
MFHSARLKLTAWYLLIIMMISLSFSVAIYNVLNREVERFARVQRLRFEHRFPVDIFPSPFPGEGIPLNPQIFDPDLIAETTHRIFLALILVNGTIFVLSGGLGYILAGRTLRPIAEMIDEQNRFISDASHELRTPLTSLKSAFEVFLRNKKQTLAESRTLVSESINEVNNLQALTDSLLQLTQYQKSNDKMTFEKISVGDVITEAIRKVAPMSKQKNISITYIPKHTFVTGNKYSLVDLIVILLDNAVKYSPAENTVTITSKQTDKTIVISVTDHGIGIDPKDVPHIFDRFFRADSARSKSNTEGYGLGLSIAKKIVQMHNGAINVETKLREGTTFTVQLPKSFS